MESLGLQVINPHGQGLDVSDRELSDLFPKIDIDFEPFGHRVVVQVRRAVSMTASGIALVAETLANEAYNNTVAKVIAIGPLAFKNRTTAMAWPEGVWAAVGDFVKINKYDGDRWSVDPLDHLGPVAFAMLSDTQLLGRYTGDVRKVRAHLA